jgi:alpha-tubulin suppressor-like RCC1 family protein
MPFIKNVAIFARKSAGQSIQTEIGPLIASAQQKSLAIKSNGQVWGWGNFGSAEIGNTSYNFQCYSTPVGPTGGSAKTFCKIAMSATTGNGLDKNGQVWSWGNNYYGALGVAGIAQFNLVQTPMKVDSTKIFCHIESGVSSYSVGGLDKNGKAWAWGYNFYGTLGVGDTTDRTIPTAVGGTSRTFCQISVGQYHMAVLDKNGKAWAWGANFFGQLGVSTTTQSALNPIAVGGSTRTFCEIQCGESTSFALDKDGKAWAWGYNNGTLGINSFVGSVITPTAVYGSKTFCKISTGRQNTLAIDKNGKLWGWGLNSLGELGDGTTTDRYTPVAVCITGKTFCHIEAGYEVGIAIDKDNKFWAWGNDDTGQLGIGGNYNRTTPVSLKATNKTFCSVYNGLYFQALALGNNNVLWYWGATQLYYPSPHTSPKSISNYSNIQYCQIAADSNAIIALDGNGKIWGWGSTSYGKIGHFNYSEGPQYTVTNVATFCKIAMGPETSFGIDYKGKLWSWGANYYGQLGQNIQPDYTNRSVPAAISGNAKTFCQISAGNFQGIAIDKNGKVWCWGQNYYGNLGDNSTTSRLTPVSIVETNTKTFCKVVGGNTHVLALDKNGKLWGWGASYNGELAQSQNVAFSTPVAIGGSNKTFCKITAGNFFSAGIDKNGKVWCWGFNSRGQLGDGTTNTRYTPVSIGGTNKTFCEIKTSEDSMFAIDKNGKLWSWGFWKFVGTTAIQTTPVQITYL